MKNIAFILLWITTAVLVAVTIMSALNLAFPIIFYLTCIGQGLLVFTVYKILTDKYKTDKKFKDWYEDHPMKND
ncbi:hypothetical protein [Salegentibacter chungangensis]|uniref:DUF4212 domain-containing protein n=1 Tax=Salegentibacter chungangensis TaxID=1335724 RepID=A0ABW3NSL1_9FLAO